MNTIYRSAYGSTSCVYDGPRGYAGPLTWAANVVGLDSAKAFALSLESMLGSELQSLPSDPPVWAVTPPVSNSTAYKIGAYWLRVMAGLAKGNDFDHQARAIASKAASFETASVPHTVLAVISAPSRWVTGINTTGALRVKILEDAVETVQAYAYTTPYAGVIIAKLMELTAEPREQLQRTRRVAAVAGIVTLAVLGVGGYFIWRHRRKIYRGTKLVASEGVKATKALIEARG